VPHKRALGADLVIPLLAAAFAAYFFWSIADLGWEAKANGVLIGTVLIGLIVVQLVRIARQLARGEGQLRMDPLWLPREVLGKRIGMVVITVAFIAALDWLGLTLSLFVAMALALAVMGVRRPARLLGVSGAVAATAYLLFIAILDSAFPHGPIERLLARLFA
jgi:hypothetical protein